MFFGLERFGVLEFGRKSRKEKGKLITLRPKVGSARLKGMSVLLYW